MKIDTAKLVNARQLLELLFEPDCRPSLRWVRRRQLDRTIPYYEIGGKTFFDVEAVREKLAKKNYVRGL